MIWFPVPGYDGYFVSRSGRVRGRSGNVLAGHVAEDTGYRMITVMRDGGLPQKLVCVHTLMLLTFVGPRPDGLVARHINGKSLDNRRANLAWGTYSENRRDEERYGSRRKLKTHCANGHEFSEDNTLYTKVWSEVQQKYRRQRLCRTCVKIRNDKRPRRGPVTECPKGHPYDAENTYVNSRGHRRCRTCHREESRSRRASI